ncbi:MAG: hypothetical protein R3D26_15395 [Cyanobacteriota/Melainabacteria group bacterium]
MSLGPITLQPSEVSKK